MSKSASGLTDSRQSLESTTRIRVRYGETDAMGWVYYGNYYLYFESARSDLIRQVWKSYRQMEDEGLKLPVTESFCKYIHGARYDDEIIAHCRLTLPSAYRMRFDYVIEDAQSGNAVVAGYTTHCFIDERGRPMKIPEDLYNALSRA